ncbi:hypothetical protein B0H17DRAFT_1221225 [Mycena rosella]|uniref:Uncharacterized protein n=1 Tax=Mycena rosella TaxID=1033263 RepID=A0AAD7F9J2_MYCRO|nr:hypothetical protein B0H17DRAFT_1221225 [Mycena rosella]
MYGDIASLLTPAFRFICGFNTVRRKRVGVPAPSAGLHLLFAALMHRSYFLRMWLGTAIMRRLLWATMCVRYVCSSLRALPSLTRAIFLQNPHAAHNAPHLVPCVLGLLAAAHADTPAHSLVVAHVRLPGSGTGRAGPLGSFTHRAPARARPESRQPSSNPAPVRSPLPPNSARFQHWKAVHKLPARPCPHRLSKTRPAVQHRVPCACTGSSDTGTWRRRQVSANAAGRTNAKSRRCNFAVS